MTNHSNNSIGIAEDFVVPEASLFQKRGTGQPLRAKTRPAMHARREPPVVCRRLGCRSVTLDSRSRRQTAARSAGTENASRYLADAMATGCASVEPRRRLRAIMMVWEINKGRSPTLPRARRGEGHFAPMPLR
jgi:hypothetical protein